MKKRNLQVRDGERQSRRNGQNSESSGTKEIEIRGRALDRLLFPNEYRKEVNTIPTSAAQSSTMFESSCAATSGSIRFRLEQIAVSEHYAPLSSLLLLLSSGRTRISQLLNTTFADVSRFGDIVIKGVKGSNPVVITDSRVKSYLLKCRENKVNPFSEYNRFTIYRYLKSKGLYFQQSGNRNKSVTHAARYDAVQAIDETAVGREASKLHLGHKSSHSTAHYGRNKR